MREGEQSWVCTVGTQICLCFALFVVLNIGQPQKPVFHDPPSQRSSLDVFFLSVVGGDRSISEQTLLIQESLWCFWKMAKVAKACKVEFVINISELGEVDPLMRNATQYFQSLTVPWYTTKLLKDNEPGHYLKKIAVPGEKSLDIIIVNTKAFQDPAIDPVKHQLSLLTKMLRESNSDWRILVSFYPLLPCDGMEDGKGNHESLLHMFRTSGADAYVSGLACVQHVDKEGDGRRSHLNQMFKGPFLITPNNIIHPFEVKETSFLLHRISSLEFMLVAWWSRGFFPMSANLGFISPCWSTVGGAGLRWSASSPALINLLPLASSLGGSVLFVPPLE